MEAFLSENRKANKRFMVSYCSLNSQLTDPFWRLNWRIFCAGLALKNVRFIIYLNSRSFPVGIKHRLDIILYIYDNLLN